MRIKAFLLSLSALVALSAGASHAATNLVKNGNFEQTSNGTNLQLDKKTGRADRTTATYWLSTNGNDGGFNFLLDSKIAGTNKSVKWMESTKNGFGPSANGGNIFASDSQYHPGTLSQTIDGLIAGGLYTLSFEYALAQQVGFYGANYDNFWQVGFGNSTQNTSLLTIPDNGFSGWKTATMTFKAGDTSQVLSFLAKGTAPGAPPFLLLDGVSLVSAVPEPSTWAMLLGGLGLVGFMARRRASKAA